MASKERIKIAIIGCGNFSPFFIPLFKAHPSVEKVYVCDLIKSRAENAAAKFGVEIIDSFKEALESDKVNSVAIFTQRFAHGKMVIDALNHGKHVYSAVPCAISIDEIKEIERLVRKTRLTYSMGETQFYTPISVFLRKEYEKGTFGKFVYAEAQYNHDIRNMENSYKSSGGEDWKKYAGLPPMFYPTHSTAMILGSMPGVYAKKVCAMGFSGSPRNDIYGTDGQNLYNNPFANTSMLVELSNGGIARMSENRCLAWHFPGTYVSQFYGTEGSYEYSVARHSLCTWNVGKLESDGKHGVIMKDVTMSMFPEDVYKEITADYDKAIQDIANGAGFTGTTPVQPTERLPKEFDGMGNAHWGSHHFLVDDFCRAYDTGKLSPTNIWQVARFNLPGLMAHTSALSGGIPLDVPDLGNPPEDWEVLSWCDKSGD